MKKFFTSIINAIFGSKQKKKYATISSISYVPVELRCLYEDAVEV